MKDKANLHLKVQEFCDCYATTDPLKEMSKIIKETNTDESALKWIALAVLHGLNNNARKISLKQAAGGEVAVTAEYRTTELPSPGKDVGREVLAALRAITHLEQASDKIPLALGFRDNSFQLNIKLKKDEEGEKLTISFPE